MTNERPDNQTTQDNKTTYNAEGDNHQDRGQRQQIHNLQHLDNRGEQPGLVRGDELPATPQSQPARRGETSRGGESCTHSMYARMPRPISWASQGGRAPKEQVYKHELILNLPEEGRGSPRRTGQERCTQQTLLAETTRADQEGDHPRQGGRGVLGQAEEGQTPSQAGEGPAKKGRGEQSSPPSPTRSVYRQRVTF